MSNPLDEAIVAKTGQPPAGEEKIDEIPYDFVRKRLSIVVRGPQGTRLICKGALDNILAVCSQVAAPQGAQPLDPAAQAAIQERFADWSAQGYRVLGLAQRSFEAHPQAFSLADENELTFSGFLLFFDPPKADVLSTIQDLKNLGVELKIITGDNRLVAAHVAESIGLTDARILTGSQINTLQEGGLMAAARQTTVFAEVDPAQKEQIIRALKKGGSVVGYMGDGINDAPSLHAADVGLSVANAVDVARDAADLVLLKQDLDVLHAGILEGRRTFANTLKYVFMATSANFGNMFSMAGASLFLPFLPMLPK
jgi:Mg2+-importing ATPase